MCKGGKHDIRVGIHGEQPSDEEDLSIGYFGPRSLQIDPGSCAGTRTQAYFEEDVPEEHDVVPARTGKNRDLCELLRPG